MKITNAPVAPPLYIDNVNQKIGVNSINPTYQFEIAAKAAGEYPLVVLAHDGSLLFKILEHASGYGQLMVADAAGNTKALLSANSESYLNVTQGIVIGAGTGDSSSVLTATSTTRGFLPPRMTAAQINAIGTPAEGLMAYDTDNHVLKIYNGTAWKTVTMA